ncbi:hypothetical protein NC651_027748 [Populus alba x Populus x berolinensis]|nr:hypothetical protein NC651_027748 [Populus alba x Populus x berolinensis]
MAWTYYSLGYNSKQPVNGYWSFNNNFHPLTSTGACAAGNCPATVTSQEAMLHRRSPDKQVFLGKSYKEMYRGSSSSSCKNGAMQTPQQETNGVTSQLSCYANAVPTNCFGTCTKPLIVFLLRRSHSRAYALTQFTTPEELDGENMYRCGRMDDFNSFDSRLYIADEIHESALLSFVRSPQVHPVSMSQVMLEGAYILFYTRSCPRPQKAICKKASRQQVPLSLRHCMSRTQKPSRQGQSKCNSHYVCPEASLDVKPGNGFCQVAII